MKARLLKLTKIHVAEALPKTGKIKLEVGRMPRSEP